MQIEATADDENKPIPDTVVQIVSAHPQLADEAKDFLLVTSYPTVACLLIPMSLWSSATVRASAQGRAYPMDRQGLW